MCYITEYQNKGLLFEKDTVYHKHTYFTKFRSKYIVQNVQKMITRKCPKVVELAYS